MPAPALVRTSRPLPNLRQTPNIILWQKSHAAGYGTRRPDRLALNNTERNQLLGSRGLQGNLLFILHRQHHEDDILELEL